MNKYFNKHKRHTLKELKWWERIILWFKPTFIGYDYGSKDLDCCVFLKKIGRKTIVIDLKYKKEVE